MSHTPHTVIAGGTVYDGLSAAGRVADVTIAGDAIVSIGEEKGTFLFFI